MSFPRRKPNRKRGYNYSRAGFYFITICTYRRDLHFGAIQDGLMTLSGAGEVAAMRWWVLPDHHADIALDAFVVMPNHVHAVIRILRKQEQRRYLSIVIGSYKSSVTCYIHRQVNALHDHVWQRGYYDRIIYNRNQLNQIRRYIHNNPQNWQDDTFFRP